MILPRVYPSDYPSSVPAPTCICLDTGYVYVGEWRPANRWPCPWRCVASWKWLAENPQPGTVWGTLED